MKTIILLMLVMAACGQAPIESTATEELTYCEAGSAGSVILCDPRDSTGCYSCNAWCNEGTAYCQEWPAWAVSFCASHPNYTYSGPGTTNCANGQPQIYTECVCGLPP